MRTLLVLAVGLIVGSAQPLLAQDSYEFFPFTRQRATNVARMKAERLNGGLTVYRPAACMYNRAGGDCLVSGDAQGYVFRFLGGPPGWQILNLPPTVETELEVSPDGRGVVRVIYNGPPRPPQPPQTPAPAPRT
jgi:hypothetical protein